MIMVLANPSLNNTIILIHVRKTTGCRRMSILLTQIMEKGDFLPSTNWPTETYITSKTSKTFIKAWISGNKHFMSLFLHRKLLYRLVQKACTLKVANAFANNVVFNCYVFQFWRTSDQKVWYYILRRHELTHTFHKYFLLLSIMYLHGSLHEVNRCGFLYSNTAPFSKKTHGEELNRLCSL